MDCSDIRKILPEHIEGNSLPSQRALIEEHLQSCEQCKLYASEIKKTIQTLQSLNEVEPPAWLTAKVMKKIREETPPRKRWIERLFFPLHIKLPLEAFAALLITVAAIFIFKNMEPELQKIEVQPQAPVMKSMPAEPEKEIQKHATKQSQRLQEKEIHKDNITGREMRELTIKKEERFTEQRKQPSPAPAPATSPVPAPSFAPSSAMRHAETGKASGMAARDEVIQGASPTAPRSELSAAKKAVGIPTFTLKVKALDAAKKEIETYIARINGECKTLDQSESRIIITVTFDPARIDKFFAHLNSLGTLKEDRQDLSLQSGLFKLIIEKQ